MVQSLTISTNDPNKTKRKIMPIAKDLLHPRSEDEKRCHKLKRLVQHPDSYFMDVKCSFCPTIKEAVFSHSQSTIVCPGCSRKLLISTGGKAKFVMEGCQYRRLKYT